MTLKTLMRSALVAVILAGTDGNGAAADRPGPIVFEFATVVLGAPDAGAPKRPSSDPAMNENGVVAFVAVQPNATEALFLNYPIGFTTRVIGSGDALAGSTVAQVLSVANGVDPFGQVLFWAGLADGRSGLFRASPPASPFSVTPTWGYRNEPIAFHLRGDGFAPGLSVQFGDTAAGFLNVISSSELAGIVPAGAPAGRVDIVVKRPNGVARTLPAAFEFREPQMSGCRGFWPDHRPPVTTSSMMPDWLIPALAVGCYRLRSRVVRRRARSSATQGRIFPAKHRL